MIRLLDQKRISTLLLAVAGSLSLGGAGCTQREWAFDPSRIPNAWLGPMTVAVAPALNLSGSPDFDPERVADLMASELGNVDGIDVIPVSRVLAVLARQGQREVGSPQHALDICEALGADAILVFAVTEYDPYDPPIIGITAQLYGHTRLGRGQSQVDPVLVSRQARPLPTPERGPWPGGQPLAQAQQVFNAAQPYVDREVRRFAQRRGAGQSPYGWRLYLASQEHYLRFCCAAVIETLVGSSPAREVAAGTGTQG